MSVLFCSKNTRLLALALLVLAITSCSMAKGYKGTELDNSEIAIVRAFGVTIHQVNDVEIGATAPGVRVAAGTNKIFITVNASNYNDPSESLELKELTVELERESEYVITSQRGDSRICAWLLSESTGQPIFRDPAGCL